MKESLLWQKLKAGLEKEAGKGNIHLCRIENGVGAGMPDVNGSYHNIDFWIELKTNTKLRPTQIAWVTRRLLASPQSRIFMLEVSPQRAIFFRAERDLLNGGLVWGDRCAAAGLNPEFYNKILEDIIY